MYIRTDATMLSIYQQYAFVFSNESAALEIIKEQN